MSKDPIEALLQRGKVTSISLDPSVKTEITKATLDMFLRDAKKHLAAKRKVHIVLVKE